MSTPFLVDPLTIAHVGITACVIVEILVSSKPVDLSKLFIPLELKGLLRCRLCCNR